MCVLSVIMPVFNETLNELDNSINSILEQTFMSFEFIIIDDNPSSSVIKNFLIREATLDSRINIIFNKRNIGPSKSTNKGIRHSKGKYIARMDADDISTSNRFSKQIKFINDNNLDFACFNFSLISINGDIVKKNCYSNISQVNQHKIRKVMSYCSIANGPSFMFKRKVFNKLNGYRARWIEDYDFASRALVHKFKIGYQSDSFLYKRVRRNSISNNNRLKQFMGLRVISNYLRKFDYTKIVPISVIENKFDSIKGKDINKFIVVQRYIVKLKKTGALKYFIKIICIIVSSKLLFNLYFWSKFVNTKQEKLME